MDVCVHGNGCFADYHGNGMAVLRIFVITEMVVLRMFVLMEMAVLEMFLFTEMSVLRIITEIEWLFCGFL